MNEELSPLEGRLYEIRRDLIFQKKRISAKIIKNIFTGNHLQSPLLTTYLDNHINYLKQSSEHTLSTVENYDKGFNHLKRFLDSTGLAQTILSDIDLRFVQELDRYLMGSPCKVMVVVLY